MYKKRTICVYLSLLSAESTGKRWKRRSTTVTSEFEQWFLYMRRERFCKRESFPAKLIKWDLTKLLLKLLGWFSRTDQQFGRFSLWISGCLSNDCFLWYRRLAVLVQMWVGWFVCFVFRLPSWREQLTWYSFV